MLRNAKALTGCVSHLTAGQGQHTMAASGLGLDLEQLNLQVLSNEPSHAEEMEKDKIVFNDLMDELERAMQEWWAHDIVLSSLHPFPPQTLHNVLLLPTSLPSPS